MQHLGTMLE